MSAAPILDTRRKVVARLKADATVIALLPAGQIFGERSDAASPWPYSRCGEFEGEPGHAVRGNVHVFSKAEFTDEVAGIVEAIGTSLDSVVLELADGRRAHVELIRTRILPDPDEQSAWHGIVTILATIPRDCTAP
jgi:hypothetical protein